jgi:hypothetical protein
MLNEELMMKNKGYNMIISKLLQCGLSGTQVTSVMDLVDAVIDETIDRERDMAAVPLSRMMQPTLPHIARTIEVN